MEQPDEPPAPKQIQSAIQAIIETNTLNAPGPPGAVDKGERQARGQKLLLCDRRAFETEGDRSAMRPQFEFGDGLSYTSFGYRELRLDKQTISGSEDLSVSVTVTNAGRRAGKGVVQLYVADLVASIAPAGKRLRRFAKIYLQPGQSHPLNFKLRREVLSFIGGENKRVTERGDFEVMIGGLKAKFTLK